MRPRRPSSVANHQPLRNVGLQSLIVALLGEMGVIRLLLPHPAESDGCKHIRQPLGRLAISVLLPPVIKITKKADSGHRVNL